MSIYHPIFDDKERKWDLSQNLDIAFYEDYWGGNIIVAQTAKGHIMRLIQHERDWYMSTKMCWDGSNEPLLESITPAFWEEYVVPYIIHPAMIDMTGEFDADDIELAQIIMDEIEEGAK